MKGGTSFISFLFIVAVSLLLVRPVVIFSSNTLQSLFTSIDGKAYGIRNVLKKRKETVRIGNIITKEVEDITISNSSLAFSLYALRKLLRKLLFALSIFLSQFIYFLKRRSTIFEIVPDNHYYLPLSVIRI